MSLGDIEKFEKKYECSIWIYSLEQQQGRTYAHCRRSSSENFERIMRLAVFENHLMLVKDARKFGQSFSCTRCGKLFQTNHKLKRHFTSCKTQFCQDMYPHMKGEVRHYQYHTLQHTFNSQMPMYPGFIIYDFESMLPVVKKQKGAGTMLYSEHVLASAAVCGLVNGEMVKHCLIREPQESVQEFVLRFYTVLFDLHGKIVRPIVDAYQEDVNALKTKIKKLSHCKDEKWINIRRRQEQKLEKLKRWILQVPVLGFNSRKYDLPLIKYYLPLLEPLMRRHIYELFHSHKRPFSIEKMISGYKMQDQRFPDHSNYITPDYVKVLIQRQSEILGGLKCAYCKIGLGVLQRQSPNGLTLDRIDDNRPHIENNIIIACHRCNCAHKNRSLKIKTTEEAFQNMENLEERSETLQMMKKGAQVKALLSRCFHFQDILNLTAPCSLRQFIKSWGVQMSKSYFCYEAFTSPEFLRRTSLPPKDEFHSWLRNDNEITPDIYAELQSLWVTEGFKNCREFLAYYNSMDAIPFMKAVINLRHHYKHSYHVDLIKNFRSIPSFALYHACRSAHKHKNEKLFPLIKEGWLHTEFRTAMTGGYSAPLNLRYAEAGQPLPSGRICKRVEGVDATSLHPYAMKGFMPCKYYKIRTYTYAFDLPRGICSVICEFLVPMQTIINNVSSGKFFGFIKVDIHTPEAVKSKFRGMLPIFKSAIIPHDEKTIGKMMAEQAKAEGRKPQKKLINSFHGKEILLSSDYLRWCLSMGLIVTNIYFTVEFGKRHVFSSFIDQMANERRLGDIKVDNEKPYKVLGESSKLMLNSTYGKFLEDISKHKKCTIVASESEILDL